MTKRKMPNHALFCLLRNSAALVKAAGVEPASENLSTQASPSAVYLFTFPQHSAGRQAPHLSNPYPTGRPG